MDSTPFIPVKEFPPVQPADASAEVYLAKGIPWDDTYKNVRLFANEQLLIGYIKSMTPAGFEFKNCSPVNYGYAVVNVPLNELIAHDCNYIMFLNSPYVTKWQYGFITKVEPLSVRSCKVFFVPDVWQTTIFDAQLMPSFIERQIVAKNEDVIGANTYPEGLEYGDYTMPDKNIEYQAPTRDERGQYSIVFASSFDNEGNQGKGSYQQDVYSGIQYNVFNSPDLANQFIDAVLEFGYIDGIIDCFMMPSIFISDDELQYKTIEIPKKYDNINGYAPKNNKLFCYPYNFLYANNNCGNDMEYKYEYFNTVANPNVCIMTYTVSLSTQPTLYAYPQDYRGMSQDYIDAITFDRYPKCPINVDSFKAWLAQTGSTRLTSGLANLGMPEWVQTGAAMLLNYGARATTAANTLSGVIGGVAQAAQAYVQPPQAKNVNANQILHSIGNDRIDFFRVQIRREYAEIIDNFFSMFGYKIMRTMPININKRSTWDYIKTQNIVVKGDLDADMAKRLAKIFDDGVTIWHTNDVGNYSLSND